MRPPWQFELVRWLTEAGLSGKRLSRMLGIPLATVQEWRRRMAVGAPPPGNNGANGSDCPRCAGVAIDEKSYAYLLGLYLGDGHILEVKRKPGLYLLTIATPDRYPGIRRECEAAIRAMRPTRQIGVSHRGQQGCAATSAYWKHWPCLFPQHGPGRKHERKIELRAWQADIVARHPDKLLRGLIHSDGWRGINPIAKGYPRYLFTNVSADIRGIFCRACDIYGVCWRQSRWNTISVARRDSVARLDAVIGPKR